MSAVAMRKPGLSLVVTVGAALAVAACGGSSNGSSSKTTSSGGGGANVAAAKAAVAPYIDKPSPFPVSEPLKKRPTGATVAYMDSGTPVGAVLFQLMQGAAKTMGVKLEHFKAGPDANTRTTGFDSAIAAKPNGVIAAGIDPALWSHQLKQLRSNGATVVGAAIGNGPKYGLDPVQGGSTDGVHSGKLMADYVIAEMNPKANVAFYDIPEVPYIGLVAQAGEKELKRICPACSVRIVHIPAATIGNTAPNTIVSDLQSHPDTNVAAFASAEIQHGLPAALTKAGIKVPTLGFAPDPTNLQDLKEGKETAALGTDLAVSVWTMMDQLARQMAGQKVTGLEATGESVVQFLTPKDITFDPSHGWTGYPDFPQRFAKLWGAGG